MLEKNASQPTISDSGTNVNLISTEGAMELCAAYGREWDMEIIHPTSKTYVTYGGNNRASVTGILCTHGIVTKLYMVDRLELALIGVHSFVDQRLHVTYTAKAVLIHDGRRMLYRGTRDPTTKLYHINIKHMVEPSRMNRANTARRASKRFKPTAIHMARQLHHAVKHIPYSIMADCVRDGTWTGIHQDVSESLLRQLSKQKDCVVCAVARWNQLYYEGAGARQYDIGEAFALDYQGKYAASSEGHTGFIIIVDLATGFFLVYGVSSKGAVIACVEHWVAFMKQHGHKSRQARSDQGAKEMGNEFYKVCGDLHVEHIPTPEKIPEKTVERMAQTIGNDIAAVLASTPRWDETKWYAAAKWSETIRATIPTAASRRLHPTKSPGELVTSRPPDLSKLHQVMVGDIVVVKRPREGKGVGVTRNQAAEVLQINLGPNAGLRMMELGAKRSITRGHAQVVPMMENDHTMMTRGKGKVVTSTRGPDNLIHISGAPKQPPLTLTRLHDELTQDEEAAGGAMTAMLSEITLEEVDDNEDVGEEEKTTLLLEGQEFTGGDGTEREEAATKIGSAYKTTARHDDMNPSFGMVKRSEALQKIWVPKMRKEIGDMCASGALQQCEEGPTNRHVWTLTTKRDGSQKARCSNDGGEELRRGVFPDKNDLYTPAMACAALKLIMAFAAYHRMKLRYSDAKQAFTANKMSNAKYQRDIIYG